MAKIRMDGGQEAAGPGGVAQRLSHLFRDLARHADGPVTIGGIRDALGDRGFAALLVLFGAINLVAVVPGSTLILAPPLMLIAAQMVAGRETPWLPKRTMARSVSAGRFRAACDRLVPWLERLEQSVRPRWWPFAQQRHADFVIGAVVLVLSVAVFVPVPFANWIPALAIVFIGLALSERDGVLLGIGVAIGALALAVVGAAVGTAGAMASAALRPGS